MRHIVRNAEPPKIQSIIFAINAAGYITAMVVEQNLELDVCARSAAGLSLHGTADKQQDKSSGNDQSAENHKTRVSGNPETLFIGDRERIRTAGLPLRSR